MKRGQRLGKGSRIVSVTVLIIFPIICHNFIPIKFLVNRPYNYLGIILLIFGLIMTIWAVDCFNKVGNDFQLYREKSILVTDGPFKYSRNPIYLGMLLWLLGMAVWLGSLITFIFPVFFFLLVNYSIIPVEESSLEKEFAMEYSSYKQMTRRWI